MAVALYMDVHIPWPITVQLRLRGVDVLISQEDGTRRFEDPDLLDRATQLGRLLVTYDHDLLREAKYRQENGIHFGGVIYAHADTITIGQAVADLEMIATLGDLAEFSNNVQYLPL